MKNKKKCRAAAYLTGTLILKNELLLKILLKDALQSYSLFNLLSLDNFISTGFRHQLLF